MKEEVAPTEDRASTWYAVMTRASPEGIGHDAVEQQIERIAKKYGLGLGGKVKVSGKKRNAHGQRR